MREARIAQQSIFENYSEHERGKELKRLSSLLDEHDEIIDIAARDLINENVNRCGRTGLSVENVVRCWILKHQCSLTYNELSFYLSDSETYRTFARLPVHLSPSRSALQHTIRSITAKTIEAISTAVLKKWIEEEVVSIDALRIDSTVVDSAIAAPSDSQLLNDGIRVLSRLLTKSKDEVGTKLRFTDQRAQSKSLAYKIFHAKNSEKEALYPKLLRCATLVISQATRGIKTVEAEAKDKNAFNKNRWLNAVRHYLDLLKHVVDQTQRRVLNGEKLATSEKIVSIFEPHTDIIVKSAQGPRYGHKVNLSTNKSGVITYFNIEKGNPSDRELLMPVLHFHRNEFHTCPISIVADGGYASRDNAINSRQEGVKQTVFSKNVGLSLHEMGVKKKTQKRLRHFRAGVEANISELKRKFKVGKVQWKGEDGFHAYVWSAVLNYNLRRIALLSSG